jgi:hypothetical protein
MKPPLCLCYTCLRASAAIGLSSLVLAPRPGQAQLTPDQISQLQNIAGNRVEALTILGGDFGLAGATYQAEDPTGYNLNVNVSKFGGAGDVGDPKPIGDTGLAWQPRLQGNLGYLEAKKNFTAGPLAGDTIEDDVFAIQFGGGARVWFGDHLSVAPTFMGMYGHTQNDYNPQSAAGRNGFNQARSLGLVNWTADTWTVRPAGNLQYVYTLGRTIFTLSSDFDYFYTESFQSSSSAINISGNSETWRNLIDVDVPLGKKLWGHELRTGGYFSRTELYDGIKTGLNTDHMYEIHGRIVLDYLGKLWKVQWIGIGASYLWGSNFDGWSFGADIAFWF